MGLPPRPRPLTLDDPRQAAVHELRSFLILEVL
jgi:hypothetical protein